MRYLLLIIAAAVFTTVCKGQSAATAKDLYSKEFNWKITLPENFENVSAEDLARLQQKGKDALEKTLGEKIVNNSKPIFTFRSDQFNYFEANQQPFDTAKDGNFAESCRDVYGVLYTTFKTQFPPETKLDSAMATEVINNLVFQKFALKITLPNSIVLNLYMFNRLFVRNELTITLMYVDEQKGQALLGALRNSKFEK